MYCKIKILVRHFLYNLYKIPNLLSVFGPYIYREGNVNLNVANCVVDIKLIILPALAKA